MTRSSQNAVLITNHSVSSDTQGDYVMMSLFLPVMCMIFNALDRDAPIFIQTPGMQRSKEMKRVEAKDLDARVVAIRGHILSDLKEGFGRKFSQEQLQLARRASLYDWRFTDLAFLSAEDREQTHADVLEFLDAPETGTEKLLKRLGYKAEQEQVFTNIDLLKELKVQPTCTDALLLT
jgi:hypothetical protein